MSSTLPMQADDSIEFETGNRIKNTLDLDEGRYLSLVREVDVAGRGPIMDIYYDMESHRAALFVERETPDCDEIVYVWEDGALDHDVAYLWDEFPLGQVDDRESFDSLADHYEDRVATVAKRFPYESWTTGAVQLIGDTLVVSPSDETTSEHELPMSAWVHNVFDEFDADTISPFMKAVSEVGYTDNRFEFVLPDASEALKEWFLTEDHGLPTDDEAKRAWKKSLNDTIENAVDSAKDAPTPDKRESALELADLMMSIRSDGFWYDAYAEDDR